MTLLRRFDRCLLEYFSRVWRLIPNSHFKKDKGSRPIRTTLNSQLIGGPCGGRNMHFQSLAEKRHWVFPKLWGRWRLLKRLTREYWNQEVKKRVMIDIRAREEIIKNQPKYQESELSLNDPQKQPRRKNNQHWSHRLQHTDQSYNKPPPTPHILNNEKWQGEWSRRGNVEWKHSLNRFTSAGVCVGSGLNLGRWEDWSFYILVSIGLN